MDYGQYPIDIITPVTQLPLGLSVLIQNSNQLLTFGTSTSWQTISGWAITGPSAEPPSLFLSNANSLNSTTGIYTVNEESTLQISTGIVGMLAVNATAPVELAVVLTRGSSAPYQIALDYGATIYNNVSSATTVAPNFRCSISTTGKFQAGDKISIQILNNTGVDVYIYAGAYSYLNVTPIVS